jgi:hypothetical protein
MQGSVEGFSSSWGCHSRHAGVVQRLELFLQICAYRLKVIHRFAVAWCCILLKLQLVL